MSGQSQTKSTKRGRSSAPRRLVLGEYPRVSRQGSREDERLRSPDFQRDLMRGVLGGEYELVPFEAEIDVSGSKPKRAILDSIIEAIEAGELDGIAVAKLDRLSRLSPKDRIELFDRIESAGGIVRSASEKIDETTPEGRLSREIFLGIARYQWEKYAEGFETAKVAAIESGRAIMATAPFGYRFDEDHRLELVEAEAEVVRELFERRAEGASFGDLADVFGELTGRERPAMSIRRMLENRVYIGELRYAELVNDEGAPAIVDVDLFEAVQAVNAERSTYGRRQGSTARALLAGIARCRGCGGPLARKRKASGYRYVCNVARPKTCPATSSIAADELDAYVVERILAELGPAADEVVEVEVELGATVDHAIAEQRLEQAQESLVRYETDVELELDLGVEAYQAGREARLELVERRRLELDRCGDQTELDRARSTLRRELTGEGELDVAEVRRLLKVALAEVVVSQAPRRLAPASERAEVVFASGPGRSSTSADDLPAESSAELVAQAAA